MKETTAVQDMPSTSQNIRRIVALFMRHQGSSPEMTPLIEQIINDNLLQYSPENKLLLQIQIGFLLLFPGICLLPYQHPSRKTARLYEISSVYFKNAEQLLPSLANQELAPFLKDLIAIAGFFSVMCQQSSRRILGEKLRHLNQQARAPIKRSQSTRKILDDLSEGHSELVHDMQKAPYNWSTYTDNINRLFNHPYIQTESDLNQIINFLFETLIFKVVAYSEIIEKEKDVAAIIKAPLSIDAKNLKTLLRFSSDIIEINSCFSDTLKSEAYKGLMPTFAKAYCQHRLWLKDIDTLSNEAELRSQILMADLLRHHQVKKACFQRRIHLKSAKASSPSKKIERVARVNKEQKSKPTQQNPAYALYQKGKFKEAIKTYEQSLLPKEKINKANRLKQVELLGCIGDCFASWSKTERRNKSGNLGAALEKKALSSYALALEQIALGTNEHQNTPNSLHEWLAWSDFILMASKSLQAPNYINTLKKEAEQAQEQVAEIQLPIRQQPASFSTAPSGLTKAQKKQLDSLLNAKNQEIVKQHHHQGYPCYLVGGPVRDSLLGRQVSDIDLTTPAPPSISQEIAGIHAQIIGAQYPIVRVSAPDSQDSLDIAPLRGLLQPNSEITAINLDNKMLVGIVLTESVFEDVLHRDFTINSLYYKLDTKELIDPTGKGVHDLQNKCLRTIIDPLASFKTDPLRMFRLIRFSVKYHFDIEQETKSAVEQCRELAKTIAPARLLVELHKLLFNPKGKEAFSLLNRYGLLDFFKVEPGKVTPENHALNHLLGQLTKESTRSENNAWLLFLAVFFWPHVSSPTPGKKPSLKEISHKIDETITQFYPFLRIDNIHLKIKQIWLQATHDKLPVADLTLDEYELVDYFKKIIHPKAPRSAGFFTTTNQTTPMQLQESPAFSPDQ